MEMHMVHSSIDKYHKGKTAVISILFDRKAPWEDSEETAYLTQWGEHMTRSLPREAGSDAKVPGWGSRTQSFAAVPLSFVGNHYYRYEGSLTTPPCTEGVKWMVAKTVLPMRPGALHKLKKAIVMGNGMSITEAQTQTALGGNARPTQALN